MGSRESTPDAAGRIVTLRDGRNLGYAEFGDPAGWPIFFFHGAGDSRLQRHHDDAIARRLGVRLITVDRPGVGLSDFQRRRRLLHWADDVDQLADHLDLNRFSVLGYSMGGPHAVACAYAIPDRLLHVGVVSGVAPLDRPGAMEAVHPWVRRMFKYARPSWHIVRVPLIAMRRRLRRDPAGFVDSLFADTIAFDREVYTEPGRRNNQIAATLEASRGGSRGLAWELAMATRAWGFPLEEIRVPVTLWYGTADVTTPPQMGRYLAESIPTAQLILWPDAGHQAIFRYWCEVLEALRAGAQ